MALDASIYQNVQARPIDLPSPMDSASKALNLSQLAMQNQQLQQTMGTNQAIRSLYSKNMGADGKLNESQFLSDLGRVNPMSAMQYQEQFNKMGKDAAEAQASKMDAVGKIVDQTLPRMKYLAGLPENQRAQAYNAVMKQMEADGIPMANVPKDSQGNYLYDPGHFRQSFSILQNTAQNLAQQKTIADTANTRANTRKTESDTFDRDPNLLGRTNDPAKLVPNFVPKDHQAKAFSEIDAAENTRKMSKSILDSFDQATKENTILRTGAGLVRTPASVMALHQAMQPTFKDLEGTVRQAAMDNTFKNVTPAPGDSEKTIATKRQALQDYLQSKLSAPTARAYGIDLTKFPSTMAYTPSKTNGDSDAVPSAYAAPPPVKPAPDGMILMRAPNGRMKYIPASQKGEAIAAGGSVVK